jgi:hypothetical protein
MKFVWVSDDNHKRLLQKKLDLNLKRLDDVISKLLDGDSN